MARRVDGRLDSPAVPAGTHGVPGPATDRPPVQPVPKRRQDGGALHPGAAVDNPPVRDDLAELLPWLAPPVARALAGLSPDVRAGVEEVRLRAGRPLEVVTAAGGRFVAPDGQTVDEEDEALPVTPGLLEQTWQIACEASVYSRVDETRHGYLTLPGGHRVGVSGRLLVEDGRIRRLRHVGGLNFRLARERPGCADPVLDAVWEAAAALPRHTLILSPPGAGKTTLLRDLVRQLSRGVPARGIPGLRVSVVDERGELAACRDGVPTRDVGPRTDVLAGCPKAAGIEMAVRALNPQVVAFDELGGARDALAVEEAAHAGVRVLATAHAADEVDLARRPSLARLVRQGLFQRVVVLTRRPRPGTVRYAGPPRVPGTRSRDAWLVRRISLEGRGLP